MIFFPGRAASKEFHSCVLVPSSGTTLQGQQDLSPPCRPNLALGDSPGALPLNVLHLPLRSLSPPVFLGYWLVSQVNGHSQVRGVFAVLSTYLESGYVQHIRKSMLSLGGVVGKQWEVCSRMEGNVGITQ